MVAAVLVILIPIIASLGICVVVIIIRRYESVERMAMIERGLTPDLFPPPHGTSTALRSSFLLIGAGLGLLLGYWLDQWFGMDDVGYFSMVFIFGGVGMGGAYLVEERKGEKVKGER